MITNNASGEKNMCKVASRKPESLFSSPSDRIIATGTLGKRETGNFPEPRNRETCI